MSIFLIGGGWQPEAYALTYGPFLRAATRGDARSIAFVLAAEEAAEARDALARYRAAFAALGVAEDEMAGVVVGPGHPLLPAALRAQVPTGVVVCGGLTPLYQRALCQDRAWLEVLRAGGIPYAGFSAGAAIAAGPAIVGGWKVRRDGRDVVIGNEDASEDLDLVEVRAGLGLVPFAVDVHASQWGTLARLVHAVDIDLTAEGWAIDEGTMLQIDGEQLTVHGLGHAYRVRRGAGGVLVSPHRSGARVALGPAPVTVAGR